MTEAQERPTPDPGVHEPEDDQRSPTEPDAATEPDAQTEPVAPTDPPPSGRTDASDGHGLLQAFPGAARVVLQSAWRTNVWAAGLSLRIGHRIVRGALDGEPANAVIEDVADEARLSVRNALGVSDLPDPLSKTLSEQARTNGTTVPSGQLSVPERFGALLDASNDLHGEDREHPAYLRLVSELAPDEARILRLFARDGPQATVDVQTKSPFGTGQVITSGITMIGRHAGCRYCDRVPAYLDNLFRLGLVRFTRQPLPEQGVYDVLEVQPAVIDALREANRATTRRRRVELTAFGKDFCTVGQLDEPS